MRRQSTDDRTRADDRIDPVDGIRPVLIVLTSHGDKGRTGEKTGFFLGELTHPLAELDAAGIPTEIASIAGGEPPVDGLDLDDSINRRYWNDPAFRERIRTTRRLAEVDPSGCSAIYFCGGHGAMWDFPNDPDLPRITRAIYESGGVVAAVCHGPAALVNVALSDGTPLLAGRNVSAFTDDEEREVKLDGVVPFLLASAMTRRGATHHPAPNWAEQVVVDGRLVTGQNPKSATGVGKALVDQVRRTARRAARA